mmetsp:Transcript_62967/g.73648  ORF Transcript_62967/g.73648 Transcript_62967/m.73648 type:complete len:128 (+) Transcript_62967:136-519(+)
MSIGRRWRADNFDKPIGLGGSINNPRKRTIVDAGSLANVRPVPHRPDSRFSRVLSKRRRAAFVVAQNGVSRVTRNTTILLGCTTVRPPYHEQGKVMPNDVKQNHLSALTNEDKRKCLLDGGWRGKHV